MIRLNILLITLSLCNNVLFSQNGPGGVGTKGIGTSLKLWLKADQGLTLNGANEVISWQDQSGNSNALSIIGTPIGGINYNGYPSVELNGTGHFISSIPTNTSTSASVFFMGNVTGTSGASSTTDAGIISGSVVGQEDNNSNNRVMFLGAMNATTYLISKRSVFAAGVTGGAFPEAAIKNLSCHYDGSFCTLRRNGLVYVGTAAMTSNFNFNRIYIGRRGTATGGSSGGAVTGNYAEIIYFDEALNNAQRIIIDNYLQAKYNGTLANHDFYVQDNPANGNFDHDVAGIGRVSATVIHNDAQGSGIVRINNPSNLDNNEFLIWGHDNGIQSAINTTDIPAGISARFDRVWRVNEINIAIGAGDVGSITMSWDLAGLGPVVPSQLRLLVDTDNDGTFADETGIAGAVSLGGTIYAFNGVTAIANNLRFTLATTNVSQTPLPIELIDFTVGLNPNKNTVNVDWSTVSEINNAFFTVERSENGLDWESISTIDGAGNSNLLLHYHFDDESPFLGTSYYRIKQTDFNGDLKYSRIQSIEIVTNTEFSVYPNPVNEILTISGKSISKESTINVLNLFGQNVESSIHLDFDVEGKIKIDVKHLKSGVYVVNIDGDIKQFVKE